MTNEEILNLAENIFSIICVIAFTVLIFLLSYMVITFPEYFSGFFFGLITYSLSDAYLKKDL